MTLIRKWTCDACRRTFDEKCGRSWDGHSEGEFTPHCAPKDVFYRHGVTDICGPCEQLLTKQIEAVRAAYEPVFAAVFKSHFEYQQKLQAEEEGPRP